MAKHTYKIIIIRLGRERDYSDFWNSGKTTNDKGEELSSDLVGFTEIVEATNLQEAISKAQSKHPKNTIAKDHSAKIG